MVTPHAHCATRQIGLFAAQTASATPTVPYFNNVYKFVTDIVITCNKIAHSSAAAIHAHTLRSLVMRPCVHSSVGQARTSKESERAKEPASHTSAYQFINKKGVKKVGSLFRPCYGIPWFFLSGVRVLSFGCCYCVALSVCVSACEGVC